MKNNRGFVPAIIILVVLIGFGVFYFLGTLKPKSVIVATPIPTIISVSSSKPVATSDPTANWKTYVDPNSLFSFKYPSDWRLEKMDLGVGETFGKIGEYQLSIDNANIVNRENFSLIDIDPWGYASAGINSTAKLVDKSFNKLNRTTHFFKNNIDNNVYYFRDFNLKSFPNLSINVNYPDQDLQTIDQIFSTFKFTN